MLLMRSSPMRTSGDATRSGICSDSGTVAGVPSPGPVSTMTSRAASVAASMPTHRPRRGCHCQASPVPRKPVSVTEALPPFHVTRTRSAATSVPSSAPCSPCTSTPGTRCSSQRVPPSVRSSHTAPPTTVPTSTKSSTTIQTSGHNR